MNTHQSLRRLKFLSVRCMRLRLGLVRFLQCSFVAVASMRVTRRKHTVPGLRNQSIQKMAAFHREVAKYFAAYASRATPSGTALVAFTPQGLNKPSLSSRIGEALAPLWYRFFRIPLDRWNQAAVGKYLREHGRSWKKASSVSTVHFDKSPNS